MKASKGMVVPRGIADQHEHKHPGAVGPTRHQRNRARAAARQAGRRRAGVVRSEWLTRSPIFGHAADVKRGGAKYGPAPLGVGIPGTQAAPLLGIQRVLAYARQTGRLRVDHLEGRTAIPLTRRQMRRALKKQAARQAREVKA